MALGEFNAPPVSEMKAKILSSTFFFKETRLPLKSRNTKSAPEQSVGEERDGTSRNAPTEAFI